LHENGKFLINSNITLYILKSKTEEEFAETTDKYGSTLLLSLDEVDDQYVKHLSKFDSKESVLPPSFKPSYDSLDEYADEYDLMINSADTGTKDSMSSSKTEGAVGKTEGGGSKSAEEDDDESESDDDEDFVYNTTYYERMNDPRPSDDTETTKMQLTNDMGTTDFGDMISRRCKKRHSVPKNQLYRLRVQGTNKIYEIKFVEKLRKECGIFSNLEFVMTYLKPRKNNANIVLETYADACQRMSEHFDKLTKTKVDLYIHGIHADRWGKVEPSVHYRWLYHLPNTNLYYLGISDEIEVVERGRVPTLMDCVFLPQMTFRFYAHHGIRLFDRMLTFSRDMYTNKRQLARVDYYADQRKMFSEYADIATALVKAYVSTKSKGSTKSKTLSLQSRAAKTLHFYVFMIYYKVMRYVCGYMRIPESDRTYLKDLITFSSRHSNYTYYLRIKEILKEELGLTSDKQAVREAMRLLYDPNATESLIMAVCDADSADWIRAQLAEGEADFGDPHKSLSSYFMHMERKLPSDADKDMDTNADEYRDWLKFRQIDTFSSQFPLIDDAVIVEDRGFFRQMIMMIQRYVQPKKAVEYQTIRDFKQIARHIFRKKWADNIKDRVLNPATNRWNRAPKVTTRKNPPH
jgi:hypothetical protein